MNGGVVEKNEVLFHDDRIMIMPREDILPQLYKREDASHNTDTTGTHNNSHVH
jgi:hypothetical protein